MKNTSENHRDLNILEKIEKNPDETQASLANQLGVAVGTINWHLKRLIAKGYVKAKRAERKKLRYIITPEGIALRARLTVDYIQSSFQLYRLVRKRVIEELTKLQHAGISQVKIDGDGDSDVADVCRLTCLERDVEIVETGTAPTLKVQGLKILIEDWEKEV